VTINISIRFLDHNWPKVNIFFLTVIIVNKNGGDLVHKMRVTLVIKL